MDGHCCMHDDDNQDGVSPAISALVPMTFPEYRYGAWPSSRLNARWLGWAWSAASAGGGRGREEHAAPWETSTEGGGPRGGAWPEPS